MSLADFMDHALPFALFALAAAIYHLGRLVGRDDAKQMRERQQRAAQKARSVGIIP